jgi:hypothetical protein
MVFDVSFDLKISLNVERALRKKTLFFFLKAIILKALKKC